MSAEEDIEKHRKAFAAWCETLRDSEGSLLNPDAQFINTRSSPQLQILLFGGTARKIMHFDGNGTNNEEDLRLPVTKNFDIPKDQLPDAGGQKVFTIRSLGLVPISKRKHWTESG